MWKGSTTVMDNQLAMSSEMTTEVIDSAKRFTDFLSSETVSPVRTSITLIPNIVADILNVALENKKLKMQNKQFERKTELARRYLDLHDKNAQYQLQLQLETIHTRAEIEISEIKQRCDVELKQIESNEKIELKKIKSHERVKIAEIETQYKLARQRQERDKFLFLKALHESNLRFNRKMESNEKAQSEFSLLIRMIMNKIVKGVASSYECKLLEKLLELNFDISEGFLDIFMEEK